MEKFWISKEGDYIKSYTDIVNKQFKVNRKRIISTVLGLILSIILLTIVGYVFTYLREINILEAKNRTGNYEAVITDISYKEANLLKNNLLTERVGFFKEVSRETISLDNKEKNIRAFALDKVAMNDIFYSNINVLSGHLPQSKDEIIIDSPWMDILRKSIGDTIIIEKKPYIIVGVYDKKFQMNGYIIDGITLLETYEMEGINAAFSTNSKSNKTKSVNKVIEDIGIDTKENSSDKRAILNGILLYYYEKYDAAHDSELNEIKLMEYSLYVIVIVLTTFLTYSSINASLKDRMEQFSILRCIGATKSKNKRILIKESIYLLALSLIPGLIIAHLIWYLISWSIFYKLMAPNVEKIPFRIYPNVIIMICIFTVINIVTSTIIPIIKIGKVSPIEGVKSGNANLRRRKKIKARFIEIIFGYNGVLAYKNITNDSKNYIVTTLASIILLTTFISFNGYNNNLLKIQKLDEQAENDINIDINIDSESQKETIINIVNRYKEEIDDLQVSNNISSILNYRLEGIFTGVKLNEHFSKNNNLYSNGINFLILDEKSIENILDDFKGENQLSLEDFKENGVLIVNRIILKNYINVESEKILDLNKGDNFSFLSKNGKKLTLKYLGEIDGNKISIGKRYGLNNTTTLIASEDFYNDNVEYFSNSSELDSHIYFLSAILEISLRKDINRNEAVQLLKDHSYKIEGIFTDCEAEKYYVKRSIEAMNILVYMVLLLIVITATINIINNKMLNLKTRKEEMGILLAIGISKNRLNKVLLLEGIIQWFIASIISIGISLIILKGIFEFLHYSYGTKVSIFPLKSIIMGVGILFIINFLPSYLSVKKLKYTDTIDLIKNKE